MIAKPTDPRAIWLLLATFLVAIAGLIYELIAATVSSFLLGDSVRQFSLVIGIFLFSMGLGAWVSRYVKRVIAGFVTIQIALALIGGFLAPVVFLSYGYGLSVAPILYGMLALVGVLSGMEIPLIARLLEALGTPRFRFENVLSVDYVGALVAAVAFPLIILPQLSLVAASLMFGVLNLAVAGVSLWLFRAHLPWRLAIGWACAACATLAALISADRLVNHIDARLFEQDIILSETTPYQKITVTRWRDRTRLFLNHSIQFDSYDEHRYHEMLVHPALSQFAHPVRVLILGGGDGMAAREALKSPHVTHLRLVDLDPLMTALFTTHPDLIALNNGALRDPRVEVLNADAWSHLEAERDSYDLIVLDLPDPKSVSLSRFYTRSFFARAAQHLRPGGLIVTHASSPTFAPDAFWTIAETMAITQNPLAPGKTLAMTPYHAYVPSFGDWGFVIGATGAKVTQLGEVPVGLRFLTKAGFAAAQVFSPDMLGPEALPNRLQSHHLVQHYIEGWDRWFK